MKKVYAHDKKGFTSRAQTKNAGCCNVLELVDNFGS